MVSSASIAPRPAASFALWSGAGLAILALHAGVVLWILQTPPAPAAEFSPPTAIMVELAPMPQATETEEFKVSPDQLESQEVESEATDPVEEPEPAQEPPSEPEPPKPIEPPEEMAALTPPEPDVPDVVEPEVVEEREPIVPDTLPELEGVVIPTPSARPKPPPPRKVAQVRKVAPAKKVPEKPVVEKPAPRSKAREVAKAPVSLSNRTAARQTSFGSARPSVTPARWQSQLMAHLERRKRSPRGMMARGQVLVAHVRFRIDDSGNVLSAAVARTSGSAEIDAEVVALVRRASPVPAPPPGTNKTITAPVRFTMR